MIIPLGDAPNYAPSRPWVNYGLIALNVGVFLYAYLAHSSPADYQAWVNDWGFVPVEPRIETFFTSMFMHAGFWHLAFNMLFLFIFGDNVEGRLGHVGYLCTYVACGLAAVLVFRVLDPGSTVPLVGASGAIFGVEGFYFLAFPRNRVRVFIWILLVWWFWVPARLFLGFTFAINLVYMLSRSGELSGGGVAYAAHVGGFLFGLLVAWTVKVTRPRTEVVATGAHGRGRAASGIAKARMALEEGEYDLAAELLKDVIRRDVYDPEAPEAALQLGILQARVMQRPEAARGTLRFAARMHPDPARRAEARAELRHIEG